MELPSTVFFMVLQDVSLKTKKPEVFCNISDSYIIWTNPNLKFYKMLDKKIVWFNYLRTNLKIKFKRKLS